MTNFEKIRQMNDEELANWLSGAMTCGFCPAKDYCLKSLVPDCENSLKTWLNSKAEEGFIYKQFLVTGENHCAGCTFHYTKSDDDEEYVDRCFLKDDKSMKCPLDEVEK